MTVECARMDRILTVLVAPNAVIPPTSQAIQAAAMALITLLLDLVFAPEISRAVPV
jgi:hypothetical protein